MKKLILLLLLFPFMEINAQEKFKPQTMLGINGGINASEVYFSPSVKQIPTFGYLGGVVLKHISEPHLGIQLELNFTQKGWKENLDSSNVYARKFNYLELPFMTHIEIGQNNSKLVVNIGPTFSYLLSNSETIHLIDEYNNKTYYNTKIDNKIELGLCLGIGFIQSTVIGDFQFESRFYQGINNIFKNNFDFSFSTNQVLSVKMSYLFRIN